MPYQMTPSVRHMAVVIIIITNFALKVKSQSTVIVG